MNLRVVPYTHDHIEAVRAFNRRLKEGGSRYQFPEEPVSRQYPRTDDADIYQEYFLAVQGEYVRGGYILRHQDFRINQEDKKIAAYQLPLSEAFVDSSFKGIGKKLLEDGLERQPLMIVLGIGGHDQPAAQFFRRMQWKMHDVPFYFRILHPFRFLRNISYLRRNLLYKMLMDLAAFSGIGWIGLKFLNFFILRKTLRIEDSRSEMVDGFASWANDLWDVIRKGYIFSSVRDSNILNMIYPQSDQRFLRIRVFFGKNNVGWAVLMATDLKGHNFFGKMKLGSIIDCLALPGFEEYVIEESTKTLKALDVDLIVTNQSYKSWRRAMKNCGYMEGLTNYLLGLSPDLSEMLEPLDKNFELMHVNRGDSTYLNL
ncbi:MAG: hypothetical protein GWO41_16280 [candidate division Zixibacteria bacterium]|nr:hypothetical protein [candidate division Zixibacteria bacterium]NIR63533.1 hypothetical protein [candidate division Zixibacteria bacterium]NIS17967.1 hypothetical protein [candidate division Zixibacteria bacterium]NIS46243.1 hypothetical protein [candidate division Zixibacteria bacterium]NIT54250.1 hypothetical protein [candidate division Zixibacteria bacterium]